MVGLWFYLIGWFLWICLTFFHKETNERLWWSSVTLLGIIASSFHVQWGNININLAFILLFTAGFLYAGRCKGFSLFRVAGNSLALLFLYATLRFIEWYDPVFFLWHLTFVPAGIMAFSIILLLQRQKERVAASFLIFFPGEVVASMVLSSLTEGMFIAPPIFFDKWAAAVFIIYLWGCLEEGLYQVSKRQSFPSKNLSKRISL
ncbi:YphA family membrane protein [Bacillus sp. FJAT-44742]|uniref:YphA family membrane protein n=1 Tax=Bacillus sp. FJAT-44742 TaxID=2014005 RepID=UPI000C24B6AC|nr:hypothetical protein [Bacillus sp. FJAT-44742]